MAPMVLANEVRVSAAILETAGLFIREDNQQQPEANVINFVTRVLPRVPSTSKNPILNLTSDKPRYMNNSGAI